MSNTTLIIIVLIVVLAAGGAYFILHKKDSDTGSGSGSGTGPGSGSGSGSGGIDFAGLAKKLNVAITCLGSGSFRYCTCDDEEVLKLLSPIRSKAQFAQLSDAYKIDTKGDDLGTDLTKAMDSAKRTAWYNALI